MSCTSNVPQWVFVSALEEAQKTSELVRKATTPAKELEENTHPMWDMYFLTESGGFVVRADGELVGLFSTAKGQGDFLITQAIRFGANHLDCFDGYLVGFYKRHGFKEDRREKNWTPGQPDVVYMSL